MHHRLLQWPVGDPQHPYLIVLELHLVMFRIHLNGVLRPGPRGRQGGRSAVRRGARRGFEWQREGEFAVKAGTGAIFGALVTSIGGSLCCLGPVVAAFLGLGLAGSAASVLEPYRLYLTAATILLLGWAFYRAYPVESACDGEKACASPSGKRLQKATLWAVTVFAVAALTFSYYSRAFL